MRPDNTLAIAKHNPGDLDLVLGAGGSRAILASTGVVLACHQAGLDRWRTISGASGGSIPAVMLAGGMHPTEIVRNVIDIDFVSQLTPRVSMVRVWWAFFKKNCLWKRRANRGVLSSEKLGGFIEKHVPCWPDNFWTVAVAGKRSLLFCAEGVYEMLPDGGLNLIAKEPAPLGLAIRATCAVPGIIDGVKYNGEFLLDGALSVGRCPTLLAKRHLNAQPGGIVACDVGEEDASPGNREHWFWRALRWVVCGSCCDPEPALPTEAAGVVLVEPPPAKIQTLDLRLSPDQKWEVIMSGFVAAVKELAKHGLLTGQRLTDAERIVVEYQLIQSSIVSTGELAARTQALMSGARLY